LQNEPLSDESVGSCWLAVIWPKDRFCMFSSVARTGASPSKQYCQTPAESAETPPVYVLTGRIDY
jgi:hypothetical protein